MSVTWKGKFALFRRSATWGNVRLVSKTQLQSFVPPWKFFKGRRGKLIALDHLGTLFSHSVVAHSLRPHGLQHTRFPCPSPSPEVCSNSSPLSWWCYPTISSSVVLFSCLQSFPASESFPMSWVFTSGGQSFGDSASASVLPMNIQDWFSLGLTGLNSLQSKGLSSVFSWTTVQKPQFFSTQPSLWSNSHIYTWLLEKP